jgi:hypothetical protein
MSTRLADGPPVAKQAKFTATDAARAFLKARGGAARVERIKGDKHIVR